MSAHHKDQSFTCECYLAWCIGHARCVSPELGCASGGIGPTHDDVTYQAIAETVGVGCSLHEPTLKRMRKHYKQRGLEVNDARKRMATLPDTATVHFTDSMEPNWVPLVEVQGVFILPGIPRLYKAMITGQQV
jgi:molybdopterin-biosynthesis enzyme MoeA-like protein